METRPIRRLARPLGGHLLFALAAVAACIVAPLLPLQTDSAYTFFRLLQLPPLNIDDLRTLNAVTWLSMRAAVRLAAAPQTLALMFALSQVVYTYILYLIARYGFLYRKAGRLALALALVSAPLWLNPANGTLNGLGYFALAYTWLEGERRTRLKTVVLAALLLPCVLADPVWLPAVIALGLCHRPETATDDTGKVRFWWPRLALLAGLSLVVWLDHRLLPQPLDFNADFFLPVYGFRNAFAFWGQAQAYAYLFLWAGWAYLAARYACRKAYRSLAILLIMTAIWLALFGFTPGYAADFGRRFLPFWVLTALLVLKEKQPAVWLAPALLFLFCGTADAYKTLDRRAHFYGMFAENLPEPFEKFLAYSIAMPEDSFQPSVIPQVEMLNYTLLYTARPRVVQFPLPGVRFQSPYEADLSFLLTNDLEWPSNQLNPAYFLSLYAKGSFDILPADFFAFRPVYTLRCTAEAYARDRAGKPFFLCQTWPDTAMGLSSGPELVERQCLETAFAGDACVKVAGGDWEALPVSFNVQAGDSLYVRVKRKGNGCLGAEDFYFARRKARAVPFQAVATQAARQIGAERDTADLWDDLEIRTAIPAGVQRVLVHVTTDSARRPSYFDNLEIVLSRRVL
ncbi:MAG: hypothetical protein K2O53_01990 [Bacteroidales bacterium]|nr:hypothetical protein [Bacteroidales bacterium]